MSASKLAGAALSVLNIPLAPCCMAPTTGFFRDGFCRTDASDRGSHTVCAIITNEFLSFTASRGNDLATPRPPSFPGLRAGDKWCLCSARWLEAFEAAKAGLAPPAAVPKVLLSATNKAALRVVPEEALRMYAADEAEEAQVTANGATA
jgi:uncharacterized protein (DUF2237 family)